MVAKKAKSKRQTARTKYKIIKKVAEHHRKQRKEAKSNPNNRKTLKKDPGIPNMFPFKEKLLLQAEENKRRVAEEKLNKKQTDQQLLAQMVKDANVRSINHEMSVDSSNSFQGVYHGDAVLTGRKDNSKKAYYREFKKVIDQADVILEILDARDPMGCRTKQIEELILNSGSNKKIILILNKIDLVPREAVEAWLKYLRNEFPTVAFKASTQNQRTNLSQSSISAQHASEALLNGSECLGADNLMKILKNYSRSSNLKTSITVGVVGFPNVGKSSVINSLKRSKVCGVGSTPGMTKVAQTIQLDKNIKLLDCPGIVFSKSTNAEDSAQVLLRNCVKVEQLEDPIAPEHIISRCSAEQLMQIYSIPFFNNSQDFLVLVARQRGKLRRGGVPDLASAARSVIQDWNQGRIPFYTIPPAQNSTISSEIVSGWAKEFSLDDTETLTTLKGKSEIPSRIYHVASTDAVPVDMEMTTLPPEYLPDEEIEDEIASDENDVDAMEEDAIPVQDNEPLPEIRFKKISKKQRAIEREAPVFTAQESEVNPQLNQNFKKLAKQRKKDQKRAAKKMADTEMEDYDFSALQ